jgi:DNA-binding PadR family transcriptional regulator
VRLVLELAILGLLKEQDLHGYELKRRLGDMLGTFSSVSFGSLYPALARLERSGAVRAVESRGAGGIPMTGSLGGERAAFRARMGAKRTGRSRKVYGITPEGEMLFERLLAGERRGEDGKSFSLRLAFARHLPPDARLRLLERRRADLAQRLEAANSSGGSSPERLDSYSRSVVEHNTELTERDISWLDRLIEAERRAASQPKGPDQGAEPATAASAKASTTEGS